ncbi:MAG: membrane protein insertase YidC [Clostridia bacterium]|nr:membrane protein insertase YidC [Clostridia bacterium]
MFEFFANTFGYVLNFIYDFVGNYGLAIILFTILVKLILLPISIKQQKTMKKSAKLQEQVKAIQFKYKNDPEKMQQEMMSLYKAENMSPFSGCLSSIVQIILLLSIFYLVRSPLTFMRKVPADTLNTYISQIQEEGKSVSNVYPEIDIIREKGETNENVKLNMEFLGLDLSQIPNQNMTDYKVWVIPVLYIISSFVSIKLTTALQQKNKNKKEDVIDITEDKKEKQDEIDPTMQTTKTMTWLMPIMAISIAFVAPLGLALYWLINNILMIVERLVLDKVLKAEEE